MKKLIMGLLALGCISSFAADAYRYAGDNMKVIDKKDCLVEIEQSADDYQRNTSSFKVTLTENQCGKVNVGDKVASVTKTQVSVLEIVTYTKSKSGLEVQEIIKQ